MPLLAADLIPGNEPGIRYHLLLPKSPEPRTPLGLLFWSDAPRQPDNLRPRHRPPGLMRLSCQLNDPQTIPCRFWLHKHLGLTPDCRDDILVIPTVPAREARIPGNVVLGCLLIVQRLQAWVRVIRDRVQRCQSAPNSLVLNACLGADCGLAWRRDGLVFLGVGSEL